MDYDDSKIIVFAQSLSREAKRWFKYLPARSIATFEDFQTLFLDRWEDKKESSTSFNPIHEFKETQF